MPNSEGIATVYGAMYIGTRPLAKFKDEKTVQGIFEILQAYGINQLDTAQSYLTGEEFLGKMNAGSLFSIDTKTGGRHAPESMRRGELLSRAKDSMRKLGIQRANIFYIHSPHTDVPMADYLADVNEAFKAGLFLRFGLSNFNVEQVLAVYNHCKQNDYILPTVYQGNFNPVARHLEFDLLPTLRELGISFYAYSPIAGGFLTKTKQQAMDGAGRFNPNAGVGIYVKMYVRPSLLEALDRWGEIAAEAGCSRAELAYRWVKYNCALKKQHGDALIIGASTNEQLEETLACLKAGPLGADVAGQIDALWDLVKHEAPVDNYNF